MKPHDHDLPDAEGKPRAKDGAFRKPELHAKQDVAAPASDILEGQLGPDELPNPVEVKMNQEARLHH